MKTGALLKETYQEWSRDKGPRLGAALAYYAIFSIPPLMVIVLAVLGFFYSDDVSGRLSGELASLIGDDTAKALLTGIQATSQKGGIIASIVGIAVLLFGASGVFGELQDALNTIWGVRPKEQGLKGLLRGRFTAFTMVLGICFLLLISLIVSAIVAAASDILASWLPGGQILGRLLAFVASVAVITFLFAMIFKILPDVEIQWADVWIGALPPRSSSPRVNLLSAPILEKPESAPATERQDRRLSSSHGSIIRRRSCSLERNSLRSMRGDMDRRSFPSPPRN